MHRTPTKRQTRANAKTKTHVIDLSEEVSKLRSDINVEIEKIVHTFEDKIDSEISSYCKHPSQTSILSESCVDITLSSDTNTLSSSNLLNNASVTNVQDKLPIPYTLKELCNAELQSPVNESILSSTNSNDLSVNQPDIPRKPCFDVSNSFSPTGQSDPLILQNLQNRKSFLINEFTEHLNIFSSSWCKKISILEKKINDLSYENASTAEKLDELEQYVRRPCLILHGIPEHYQENSAHIASDFLNHFFNSNISPADMVVTHRLGSGSRQSSGPSGQQGHRPLIIKFFWIWDRDFFFKNKKVLKGTKFIITECLTPKRRRIMEFLRSNRMICWSVYGKIYSINSDGQRIRVFDMDTAIDLSGQVH